MRIKKLFLLLIASIAFSAAFAAAASDDNPEWMFAQANELYRQEKYSEALAGYQKIVQAGWENGPLYYNIGNCFFKTADYGRAILNYERAFIFTPRDVDLKANYVQAMTMAGNTPDRPRDLWYREALEGIFSGLSINALAILAAAVFNLLLVMIIVLNISRPLRKNIVYATLVTAFIFAVTTFELAQRAGLSGRQCVAIKPTEAKFAPLDGATAFFDILEGDKLTIVSAQDTWYKIRRPDGKSGWAKKEILEMI